MPKVKSENTPLKSLIKTASQSVPEKGRILKRLEAEKVVLEGRLVIVSNLLTQLKETPELATAIDIILSPLEINE